MSRTWRIVAVVVIGWLVLIGVLLQQDFFGLFRPDDLGRWQQPPAPAFVATPEMDDRAVRAREMVRAFMPEAEPAYTQEQAEAIARRVQPLVEKACAREFTTPPQVRVANRDELAAVLARAILRDIEARLPNARSPFMTAAVEEDAAVQSAAYLGLYDPQDKVLLLAAGNVGPLMDAAHMDRRHLDALVTLIIAHELTHALQDQVLDLQKPLEHGEAADARLAFHCALEGHAVLVQEAVGGELGLDEAVVEASRMFAAGAATPEGTVFDWVERADAVQFEQIYLGGRDFIAYHQGPGGPQRVWEILAAPPPQTSMIAQPQTYSPTPDTGALEWYMAFRDLENDFGPEWDVQDSAALSGMQLHAIYAGLDRAERDRLIASLDHVQSFDFRDSRMSMPSVDRKRTPDPRAALFVLALRQDADVAAFFASLERLRDVPGQRPDEGADPEFAWYRRDLQGVRADDWSAWSCMSDGLTWTRLYARRGRILCDLTLTADPTSDEALAMIANSILDRADTVARRP